MLQIGYSWRLRLFARVTLIASIAVFIWGCQTSHNDGSGTITKEILQQWQGDLPVSSLVLIPSESHKAGIGYINNATLLKAIWPHFQPSTEIPNIDFEKNIIVYNYNTQFYNRNRIFKVEVSSGVAEVLAMETLAAIPIEDKVAISMAVISRKGIDSLKTRDGVKKIQHKD